MVRRLFSSVPPVVAAAKSKPKHFVSKFKAKPKPKNSISNPEIVVEVSGFQTFSSKADIHKALEGQIAMDRLDCVFDADIFPNGSFLLKLEMDELKSLKTKISNGINLKKVASPQDVQAYRTASKLGITECTILAYNVPPSIGLDEMHYAFEDFSLAKKGITKLSRANASSLTSSFLLFFSTLQESERAMFRMNGVTLAGNHLYLHRYL
jgi:hypothetical protein